MSDVLDYDSMSLEELEQSINSMNSDGSDENGLRDEPQQEQNEDENSDEETAEEDGQEVEEGETEEETETTKGKSRAELLKMIKNGTQKISKQQNEIYEYKTKLTSLEKPAQKPNWISDSYGDEDPIKKLAEKYNEEDLKAIELVVNKRLSDIENSKQEQTKAQIAAANQANEDAWILFQNENPDLYEKYKSEILEEISQDKSSTYDRPGWVMAKVLKLAVNGSNKATGQTVKKSVVKRTVGHTASSGSPKPPSKGPRKSVDQMSPEEYVEYCKSDLGIDLEAGKLIR